MGCAGRMCERTCFTDGLLAAREPERVNSELAAYRASKFDGNVIGCEGPVENHSMVSANEAQWVTKSLHVDAYLMTSACASDMDEAIL